MNRVLVIGIGMACTVMLAVAISVFTYLKRTPSPQFEVESVTFISANQGWALGRVRPCASDQNCRMVQQTIDGGRSWRVTDMIPPPGTRILDFVNARDGWARANGSLWSTHDGGGSWQESRNPAIESTGWRASGPDHSAVVQEIYNANTIWAVKATQDGTLDLYTGTPDNDDRKLSSSLRVSDYVPRPEISIAYSSDKAWIWISSWQRFDPPHSSYGFSRVSAGARIADGRLHPWTPPCSGVDERIAGVEAPSVRDVFVVCASIQNDPYHPQTKTRMLVSRDAGETFTDLGEVFAREMSKDANVVLVAAASPNDLIVHSEGTVFTSSDGGVTWNATYSDTHGTYIKSPGFVTPSVGFILKEKQHGSSMGPDPRWEVDLLATRDAGLTWEPVTFASVE